MSTGKEEAARSEIKGPRMISVLIMHEAGEDYREYLDKLYREHQDTEVGEALSGVAYLVGTWGATDPFEMYFERARSFHDGLMLGLRVAKEELGPEYAALLSKEMELMDIEEWKRFFAGAPPAQRASAAQYICDVSSAGLDALEGYRTLASSFFDKLPCFDKEDNLLMHGFGYMVHGMACVRESQLEASGAVQRHGYRPLDD